jgi:hypothetical protein
MLARGVLQSWWSRRFVLLALVDNPHAARLLLLFRYACR